MSLKAKVDVTIKKDIQFLRKLGKLHENKKSWSNGICFYISDRQCYDIFQHLFKPTFEERDKFASMAMYWMGSWEQTQVQANNDRAFAFYLLAEILQSEIK